MQIGFIGLGKMGLNMAVRLGQKGHRVVAFDAQSKTRAAAQRKGIKITDSFEALIEELPKPRFIWLMVPHSAVDSVLAWVLPLLDKGDILIDGGNSYFELTRKRADAAKKRGIRFVDAGISGGPGGARDGACIMAGGEKADVRKCEPIFKALAAPGAYEHVGKAGAGHFVKMVHNGIEYGMMQAIAEGFAVLKRSPYKPDVEKIARLYNHRSVIESRLVGWLEDAYKEYGRELRTVSGTVTHTGEGEWTIKTAKKLGVPVPVIGDAFLFRVRSAKSPSYTGKVLSALRNRFGGHATK